jgi:hypothetical protein
MWFGKFCLNFSCASIFHSDLVSFLECLLGLASMGRARSAVPGCSRAVAIRRLSVKFVGFIYVNCKNSFSK